MGRRRRRHGRQNPDFRFSDAATAPERQRLHGGALPWELFLTLLGIYAVAAVLASLFADLSPVILRPLWVMDSVICAIFLGDFVVKLGLAGPGNRWRYLREHWLDLASSLPAIGGFNYHRVLRILRIVTIARDLSKTGQVLRNIAANRAHWGFLAVMGCSLGIFFAASMSVVYFEQNGGGNIQTAEDAMWWSLSTLTTVGYGDKLPVTPLGRYVGFFLMTCGIVVFSTVVAYVSTLLRPAEHESSHHHEVMRALRQMDERLARLEGRLAPADDDETPAAGP